jgi:O-antigen/teichoic acid export membrane protein
MLVVLAKLGSPEMVGQFALGLAMTAPVMMFASLRMRLVQATDARREYSFGDYLGLRMITTTLGLLVIVGIILVAGYPWETTMVILAVGAAKALESISDVFYGLVQSHDRMDRIAKSMILKGPLSLAALSIGVYLTGSVLWGAMGLVGSWAVVLVLFDIRSGALMLESVSRLGGTVPDQGNQEANLHPRWDTRTLAKLAWLMLPLGFVVMLSSLHSNIPRYFVERSLGVTELGIFAALAYFERSGNLVVKALAQSASPQLARHYAARDGSAFRRLLLKLAGVGALLAVFGVLVALFAGREILTLLYQPEYAQQRLFVELMIAAGLSYIASFLIYGVSAARYFRVQVLLYAAVAITLVLACAFWIPSEGLHGAAKALILASGTRAAGSLVITGYVLLALRGSKQGTRLRIVEYDAD